MTELREVVDLSDNERVYRHVRREIIEGRFRPGERIVEARVADALAVSRTPVREAVRRLETEGLVVTEPNRGAQVRSITEADIADMYEARARLESLMAELATQRAQPDDIDEIQAAADKFDEVVASVLPGTVEGARALLRANDRFHGALVQAARSEPVFRVLRSAVVMPLVFISFERYTEREIQRSASFHQLITEAVRNRQPERASRLMTEHVLQGRDAHLRGVSAHRAEVDSA